MEPDILHNDPRWESFKNHDKLQTRVKELAADVAELKALIVSMAEVLLFYYYRGGGRAKDLFNHPLTQKILNEAKLQAIKVEVQ